LRNFDIIKSRTPRHSILIGQHMAGEPEMPALAILPQPCRQGKAAPIGEVI